MAGRRRTTRKKAARKRTVRGPARKRVAKQAGPRRGAKKVARRRAAKPAAKRETTKRKAAKRAATKRATAKRRTTKRAAATGAAAKHTATKRTTAKRTARPAIARRPARRPAAPAAFAPQKAGASAKDLLLFEIERARVAVTAAIQGLGAGSAARPVGEGRWSIHEVVLHLTGRDRVRLAEFDAMLAGRPASWADVPPGAAQAAENEAQLATLRGLPWDEAVRLLATTREALMDRLRAVPAEPAEVWSESHPFGAMMHRLPGHDRGHAEAIKNARIAG